MEVKELDKLISLCRKRGVLKLKMGDIELELSEVVPPPHPKQTSTALDTAEKPWDQLSDEEKMFYSSGSSTSMPE
jgi:hypothetical protein